MIVLLHQFVPTKFVELALQAHMHALDKIDLTLSISARKTTVTGPPWLFADL